MTTEQNNAENVEETEEQATQAAPDKSEGMIPKSRLDKEINKRNEMTETLRGLVDEFKEDVPEDLQDLIPDLSPADQLKWLRSATKKGLFATKVDDSPASETPGKSSNDVDLSNMSSYQKLNFGFNK